MGVKQLELMDTRRGTSHTVDCGEVGAGRGIAGFGGWGGITLGEIPDVGDGGMEAANNIAMCVPM